VAESCWLMPGVAPRLSGHPTRRPDAILSYHSSTARVVAGCKTLVGICDVRELIIVSNEYLLFAVWHMYKVSSDSTHCD
jgi:hypothetical protein